MGRLFDILAENGEEISRALSKNLQRAGCEKFQQTQAGRFASLADAMKACRNASSDTPAQAYPRPGDEPDPRRWAKSLHEEAVRQGIPLQEVLGGLNSLQRVVRFHVVKAENRKNVLLEALDELGTVVDRLRQCYLKHVEEALVESQARKNAILESSLDPIITIDHNGVITEFNRAAEQTFGHSRKEVLGTQPSEVLFPPDNSEGHQNRIDRYLDAGEGSLLGRRIEVEAVRANGEMFPAELAMTISQEQGWPVLSFFVRDISKRKKAEEARSRYAAELERSNRELEQFAYVASHDLQEPLRKIRTFGDRLEMKSGDLLDDTGRQCVQRMQSAAARMQTLIEGLLTLSRVTTKDIDLKPTDLSEIAHQVVSDLEVKIEQVEGRVEIGKLPRIQADPMQMRQLLQNLIGNALKFHRVDQPPHVKVSGRFVKGRRDRRPGGDHADEQCCITVEDNGIGFDEKYLDRVFDIFQRLHSRDTYEGTGIGLAICRRIVERHRGTITARSVSGKGTTFEIVVPVAHPKKGRK